MKDGDGGAGHAGTPKRADARRNEKALLDAAAAIFVTAGVEAPVRDIAAKAGVGLGTIYRHFPTRADLVIAVYRHQVEACAEAGPALLASNSTPYAALAQWVDMFVDFLVTKHGLAAALRSEEARLGTLHAYFLDRLVPACAQLLDAAAAAGEIRRDIDPFALLFGIGNLCAGAGHDPRYDARRMVGLLVAGLRQLLRASRVRLPWMLMRHADGAACRGGGPTVAVPLFLCHSDVMVSRYPAPGLAFIPSPPASGLHLGPLFIHAYGLMYVIGIALAVAIAGRRWAAAGGDRSLVYDVLLWGVPAGIIGGRIYFDITTPFDITPHTWWGPLAVWKGGLGIWGGIALGALVGVWRVHRAGASVGEFMNAAAPALLVAQGVGRIGNYFNQELFGKPSSLPWAVEISGAAQRGAGISAADLRYSTFQPSFLYELIFDLAWAAVLVWLGHHKRIRPQGLFALYVAGYSGYRIFEETIRIDSSAYFLGLRLNFFIAIVVAAAGLAWFIAIQRRAEERPARAPRPPGMLASPRA